MVAKKKIDPILASGISALALGIVLVFSVGFTLLGPALTDKSTFTEINAGEYASHNISLTDKSVLYVLNVTRNFELVPSPAVNKINLTNVANFSVEPVPGQAITVGGINFSVGENSTLYGNLAGNYTIVSFSNSPPNISYLVESTSAGVVGNIGILGFIMAIASIPAIIYGALRQIRRMRDKTDIEDLL